MGFLVDLQAVDALCGRDELPFRRSTRSSISMMRRFDLRPNSQNVGKGRVARAVRHCLRDQ
jgi:hypothetical protein